MNSSTKNASTIITLILRAVALAMAGVTIVMSILGEADTASLITLLSIGLFSLALDALNRDSNSE